MAAQDTLTNRALDQAIELTEDHQQVLADLAARVEPFAAELAETWGKVYREIKVREPLPPETVIKSIQVEAVRLFFSGFKQGNLREFFASFGLWGRELASSGMCYDQVLIILREYRRAGMPFLLRVYRPGADLQLVLAALDDLYAALVITVGASYIQAAQEQLVEGARLRTVGQLAGGASHSLNNFLTSIVGRAQLLHEHARDAESQRESEEILQTAAAAAQVVRRLQDFMGPTREEKDTETDLNTLLREAAEVTRFIWRDQAEARGIVIDVVKDLSDIPPVYVKPSEMREVFVALVLNAIEAMPRGGLITLRSERRGDQALASVIDTGEGMSEATRLRVFDPFFTTKGPIQSGLGLSRASAIVEEHGGVVAVRSEAGRGTTFTIALPFFAKATASKREPAPAEALEASETKPGPQILVIDDEAPVRDVAVKFLTFRGYSVAVADSGSEGLAAFKKHPFDLVITDLGMPGMPGWQVAREIKKLNPKTLVVLMTGWATDLDAQKVKESGVDRVVHKPFDVDEVLALIKEANGVREKM